MIVQVDNRLATRLEMPAQLMSAGLAPGVDNYLNVGSFRFWFVGQRWEWSTR